MKTAISIPNDLYEEAEKLARQMGKTRSRLYREALIEYLAKHSRDNVTDAMNQALEQIEDSGDPFLDRAATRLLERSEW